MSARPTLGARVLYLFTSVALFLATLEAFRELFFFLRDASPPDWLSFIISILWGVVGISVLFYFANQIVEQLGDGLRRVVIPWVFIGPAVLILVFYLVLPTIRTFEISFYDARSVNFVGIANYVFAFASRPMLESFRNNLLWLVLGPG